MENSQIEDKALEFIDALRQLEQGSAEDADQLVALFAPDATLSNAALDLKGVELKGTDQILEFWVEYKETLGQIESKFHHVTASDRAAGLFWTTKGQRTTGEEVKYHGSTLLQFNEAGLIEFFRGYYDTQSLVVRGEG